MNSSDKWALVHTYRRAVANGHALPIRCPDCDAEMVPVVVPDGDPGFKCLSCRSVYDVGLHVYDQIIAAVREAVDLVEQELKENNDD